jgi:hypothetical protein
MNPYSFCRYVPLLALYPRTPEPPERFENVPLKIMIKRSNVFFGSIPIGSSSKVSRERGKS